jgi:hypothetical protein
MLSHMEIRRTIVLMEILLSDGLSQSQSGYDTAVIKLSLEMLDYPTSFPTPIPVSTWMQCISNSEKFNDTISSHY